MSGEVFMRKVRRILLIVVVFLVMMLILFTIWDNNRIIVVEQKIEIDDLSLELDGFTILQVTDLHEKEFGHNQSKLIEKINGIEYDAIVFTGDMLETGNTTDFHPFYSLIEGIDQKEHGLFVPGNSDPKPYLLHREIPYEMHEFMKGMEERGIQPLESIYTIERGSVNIHFVEFELSLLEVEDNLQEIEKLFDADHDQSYYDYLTHQHELLKDMRNLDSLGKNDVLIALYHYPLADQKIDHLIRDPNMNLRNFDLILAGHYHGGQIRLPFVGALFVPEPYMKRNGLFPPQDRVKGLWEHRGIQQYVSAGLGSSNAIPFLNFRFLNPPEINVITLRRKPSS